jgi:hypothetical protein
MGRKHKLTPHQQDEVRKRKADGQSVRELGRSYSPDPVHISTSLVERQNLTMRMTMRRFTGLTNGFSKKLENLQAAVSLHFAHYNNVRTHKTLRVTPAMAARK